MRSKILSVILSICMVLTLTPAMAFAAGDATVSISTAVLNPAVEGVKVTTDSAIATTSAPAIVLTGDIEKPEGSTISYTIDVKYAINGVEETTASGIAIITVNDNNKLTVADGKENGAGAGKITFTGQTNTSDTFVSVINIDGLKIAGTTGPDEPGSTTEPAIEVPETTTKPAISDDIDTESLGELEKPVVEDAIKAISTQGINVSAENNADLSDALKAEAASIEACLAAINGSSGTYTADEIEVKVESEIAVDDIKANVTDGQVVSLTLDLDYVCQTKVSTKDGSQSNIPVGGKKSVNLKKDNSYIKLTMVVPLPENFINGALKDVAEPWVLHEKSASSKFKYKGALNSSTGLLTFVNENGFSKFTVSATEPVIDNGGSSGGGGGGGGSSATTYTVTVPSSIDHGKITVSPKSASKGKTVTITATPDEGYKVGTITVKDKDGNEIEVKDAGDGKYTFVMPASKVDISATFVEDDGTTEPTDPTTPSAVTYSDVAETAWYYDAVKYVTENGLMNGVGNDRFAPNSNLTRAMFAQILYNKEGKPAAGASTFSDVAAGQWYTDAISWAAANGVVNGIGNNMFGPNNNITREQLAVMLYRYAGSPAVSGSVTGFNDASQISSYATTAMAWATTNGVMNGKGDGRLDPKGLATRAEVAQMMQNYFK